MTHEALLTMTREAPRTTTTLVVDRVMTLLCSMLVPATQRCTIVGLVLLTAIKFRPSPTVTTSTVLRSPTCRLSRIPLATTPTTILVGATTILSLLSPPILMHPPTESDASPIRARRLLTRLLHLFTTTTGLPLRARIRTIPMILVRMTHLEGAAMRSTTRTRATSRARMPMAMATVLHRLASGNVDLSMWGLTGTNLSGGGVVVYHSKLSVTMACLVSGGSHFEPPSSSWTFVMDVSWTSD
jgi:hypothetical protein